MLIEFELGSHIVFKYSDIMSSGLRKYVQHALTVSTLFPCTMYNVYALFWLYNVLAGYIVVLWKEMKVMEFSYHE